ncbi:hypothetical protein OH146_04025 [Salinibacterium sp. SYSU T00001]|uniref:HAAS signaling domain-containing protein n=1 Tax=Homoserinimonas sedimenticola TaxID=2986805 RepID=UPI0022367C50|nr:hypothetical protein [Salinibacterium sedimenticola]MCW4384937.1 hypothetical protein [Salinibacterium sedimenticola]
MNQEPQVVRNYLAQLDAELASVEETVARDIRAGIAEELQGLDAAAAAARIEQLGDPAFIAAEARAAAPEPRAQKHPRASSWYVVLASLMVAFGGLLVPVLGWLVGIVLVLMSPVWRLWEKLLALCVPVVCVAASAVVALLGTRSQDAGNPLVPASYDITWTALVLLGFVNVIVGIWLLLRGLSRTRV